MSENINVFGLQSFTDPNEAWKVMSCDFGSYEINLQILNDKTFVKAVMEQIIIRVVDYKTGRISREELEFRLGVNSEAMDTLNCTPKVRQKTFGVQFILQESAIFCYFAFTTKQTTLGKSNYFRPMGQILWTVTLFFER